MNQRGFALVFVLLVVAALELLAISTLALATHESVAVHAERRTVAARRTAEAALRRFARGWPHPHIEQLAVGGTHTAVDSSGIQLTVQRHAWGLYEITAAAPAGPALIREALILRTLDFPRALHEAEQAMQAAGSADTASCTLPALAAASLNTLQSSGSALGGVRWEEAPSIADTVLRAAATLTDTDSLGAPLLRVWFSPSHLAVGGRGSGVLFVDGNLDVLSAFAFHGIVVVRGTVSMAPDARITGSMWVRQTGGVLPDSGHLVYSRCWSARALLESPGARRAIRAQRRFIPAF